MLILIEIMILAFALMLGIMGTWQWRHGYRVSGGLSIGVAVGLAAAALWILVSFLK